MIITVSDLIDRNGVELPPITKDDSYDFNYQQRRTHNPERTVRIGDELMTVCEYTTSEQNRPVVVSLNMIIRLSEIR